MDRASIATVPLRGHPLHRDEDIEAFFIVGAGRSGTTLVRRILGAHSALHVPPESRLAHTVRVYRRNRRLVWEDLVRVSLGAFAFTQEFSGYDMPLARVYNRAAQLPRSERSLARVLDLLFREHARRHGVGSPVRWGDKTPSNARFLDRLSTVFPKGRVIHVLRDGVDVAASSVEAQLAPDLTNAILRWRSEAGSAAKWCEAHPERSLTVRYRDLVTDPAGTAERMCTFLGVAYEPTMLEATDAVTDLVGMPHMRNVLRPVSTNSIGKGRRSLVGNAELLKLADDIDPVLEKLGYSPVPR